MKSLKKILILVATISALCIVSATAENLFSEFPKNPKKMIFVAVNGSKISVGTSCNLLNITVTDEPYKTGKVFVLINATRGKKNDLKALDWDFRREKVGNMQLQYTAYTNSTNITRIEFLSIHNATKYEYISNAKGIELNVYG